MIYLKIIIEELFYFASLVLVVLAAAEFVWPGIVLAYVNLSVYLFFWLVIAIINVLMVNIYSEKNGK